MSKPTMFGPALIVNPEASSIDLRDARDHAFLCINGILAALHQVVLDAEERGVERTGLTPFPSSAFWACIGFMELIEQLDEALDAKAEGRSHE